MRSKPSSNGELGSRDRRDLPVERTGEVERGDRGSRDSGVDVRIHDFFVAVRQLAPFALVAFAVFVIAMPVSTVALPDTSILNGAYTHDQLKFRFWNEDLSLAIVMACALYGVTLGLRAFRFLLVRNECTAVLSLPLSRTAVFGSRALACLASIVAAIGVPLAVSLVCNAMALGAWQGEVGQFAYVLVGLALAAGIACAVTTIACALAGTIGEAAALTCALLACVTVACWGLNALMGEMLVGNAFGAYLSNGTTLVAPSLVQAAAELNPLLFFAGEAAAHQVFWVQHPVYFPEAGDWPLLLGWLAALAVLTAAALLLFRRRKGENAGIAGLSIVLQAIVGIVVGLAVFGAVFTMLAGTGTVVAIVAAFAVFLVAMLILFKGPLRSPDAGRRPAIVVGVQAAALAIVLTCVGTGGLGYAGAVPAAADIESVQVSIAGQPSYVAGGFTMAKSGSGSFYYHADATFSAEDADAFAIVREAHAELAEAGGRPVTEDPQEFSSSVVPYDVVVRYTLTNGGELVRYYDRAPLGTLSLLATLDATAHGRELSRAAISGDASGLSDDERAALGYATSRQVYAQGAVYLSDALLSSATRIDVDDVARAELLAALAEDVAAQDVEDRYHPSGACRGAILFSTAGEQAADTFAYGVGNCVVYLTDEFRYTLAWLDAYGLSGYVSETADVDPGQDGSAAEAAGGGAQVGQAGRPTVTSIAVQRYAPHAGMNGVAVPSSALFLAYRSDTADQFITMKDFGNRYTETDPTVIAQLLPLCRDQYFMDDGGYLICATFAHADGETSCTYLFLPASDASDELKRVVG